MADDTTSRKKINADLENDFLPQEEGGEYPVLRSFPSLESAAHAIQSTKGDRKSPHRATPESRQLVGNMVACGIAPKTIAKVFGTTTQHLNRIYAEELEAAKAIAVSQLGAEIYERAMDKKDKSSAILAMFWMKANANWRDHGPAINDGSDDDDDDSETVTVTRTRERLIEHVKMKTSKKPSDDDADDDDHLLDVTPNDDED